MPAGGKQRRGATGSRPDLRARPPADHVDFRLCTDNDGNRPRSRGTQRCRCCEWSTTSCSATTSTRPRTSTATRSACARGSGPKLDFPGYLALPRRHAVHPHRRVANLRGVDEEGRHSDLDESARHRARRPHRVQREPASPRCARGSSSAASSSAKTCSTTSGSGNSFYTTRTASRSSSISRLKLDFDWRTEVKRTDYGFIGVGRMGAHMARRLLKAGFSLTVFDTSKEATDELAKSGAQVASSALEAASTTETAFLSLPTPDIVQKVCVGPHGREGPEARRRLLDDGTEGRAHRAGRARESRHRLHGRARQRRHGRRARRHARGDGVRARRPSTTSSSPRSSSSASCSTRGEGAGHAQVMKLANNMLAAAVIVMSSEAIAMGTKAGLNPRQMCDIINAGSGRNSATQDKFPRSVLPRHVRLRLRHGALV